MSTEGAQHAEIKFRDQLGLSSHFFFSFAALGFVAVFIPLFLRDKGLSFTEIGALSAVHAFAGAIIQIPMGILSDRLGSRKMLAIVASFIMSVIYLAYDRADTFAEFFILFLLTGVLFFTVSTLTITLISDWTAGGKGTGKVYGVTRIWGSIGWIVTLILVSLIPTITEGNNLLPSITALFLISGISIWLVTEGEHVKQERKPILKGLPELLGNRNLSLFLFAFFLSRLCQASSMGFLSIYIEEMGGSRSLIAWAFAFSALVELPFMLWVGSASDRFGRRPPLAIAFIGMPFRMMIYSMMTVPGHVFYAQAFHGITFAFMLVASMAFVADQAPGRLRATAQGLLMMATGLSMALGPLFGGWLADTFSMSVMYIIIAVVSAITGLIFILFVHESHPAITEERLAKRLKRHHFILRPAIYLMSKPLISLAWLKPKTETSEA